MRIDAKRFSVLLLIKASYVEMKPQRMQVNISS